MNPKGPDTSSVARPGAFLGRITNAVRERAAQRFGATMEGLTLDVGCGNGLFFASLERTEGHFVGIDHDLELFREATQVFEDNQIGNVWLALAARVRSRSKTRYSITYSYSTR